MWIKRALFSFLIIGGLFAQPELTLKWDCQTCHAPSGWTPLSDSMKFNHERDTVFPLIGAHRQTDCRNCHLGGDVKSLHDFTAAPEACSGCHVDFHKGRYGVDCERCHRADSWDMSFWNQRHQETLFPLVGAHRGRACTDCHTNGNYRIDSDCTTCHAKDFDVALESHAGFTSRSDCSLCHGPTNWFEIMALNHDQFFPINRGRHFGQWQGCNDCHQSPGNYTDFTCFGSQCHAVAQMDGRHCEGSQCLSCDGFTYPGSNVQSQDCYTCHPQGDKSKCGD